jgi:vacuolar-type H+-ATPase subunit H
MSHSMSSEISPLDQIRQAEAEMNRRIAAARESAATIVAGARQQAEQIKRQAQEDGKREGLSRYREIVAQAEEEARAIAAEAKNRAQELHRVGQGRKEQGVGHAIDLITGLGESEKT